MHRSRQHVRPRDHGRQRRRPVEQILSEIVRELFQGQDTPVVIAVGGPGGTGKSTLARALADLLGDAAVLRLDDYKTARAARRKAGIFGPHPRANKMELIAEHLRAIRRGETIEKPVYDPSVGDSPEIETYRPARFNLVDGEVATYADFHDLVDFSIFIDSDWRTQLATRLDRDLESRDYSPEKAVATFLHSNLREFSEHGAEGKSWADVHLFCHEDYRLELECVSRDLYERVEDLLHEEVEEVGFRGLIVPLLTPFGPDGELDQRALVEHVDWLAEAGCRRLLVAGTTGEFFSLTPEERLEVLKLVMEYFPGLVLFHVGAGPLPEALHLARRAEELGADALLCLPPCYYAGAPEQGVVSYLQGVAQATDLPLVLYNFPRHTQNPLTPEVMGRVPHFALKDSSGNRSLIGSTPRYFLGDDANILPAMKEGASGFVSGASNVAPRLYVALERAVLEGQWQEAERLQGKVRELCDLIRHPEIPWLKSCLSRREENYPAHVRPPMTELVPEVGPEDVRKLIELSDTKS